MEQEEYRDNRIGKRSARRKVRAVKSGFRWRRVAGVALLLAAALAVIGVFSQLCVTDETDVDLMDRRGARFS